jgi:hypothetical protein
MPLERETSWPAVRPDFPLVPFDELARSINSRFFSMDNARTELGEWIVIEVGDGQVTGLPETVDAAAFYTSLAAGFHDVRPGRGGGCRRS